ncbi:MAG: ARMT1-like domain-containing protein [Syntrophobacterales bacterium]|nr:ARMT1-like domain-containing protein [Syntrophobacterales bacterium]
MQPESTPYYAKLWTTPLPKVCIECLKRLVFITATEASQDKNLQEKAQKAANEIIEELWNVPFITPAQIANRFHPVIKQISKNRDPFRSKKIIEMETARRLSKRYPPMRGKDLEDLLRYSLIGNSIDFFRDIDKLEESIRRVPNIVLDDISRLAMDFQYGKISRLIILADNAGEVYFDIPLARFLVSKGVEVFYAVKEAPVQNDLSMEDLIREKLLESLKGMGIRIVSTGVDSVGLDYERASLEFKRLYGEVDLILAKGMGHLETLGKSDDERLFYLFEAKCPTIAYTFGLSIGDFLACWGSSLMVAYNQT